MLEVIRRADRYPDLARRSKGLLQFGALMEELAALAEGGAARQGARGGAR